jgi:hypothetical protein
MMLKIIPDCSLLLVEADEQNEHYLSALSKDSHGQLEYSFALLAASSGDAKIFFRMGTGSAVFEERSPYQRDCASLTTKDT